MTINIKKHAIALSGKEFAILEKVSVLGACTSEQVQESMRYSDLLEVKRILHDLADRNLVVQHGLNSAPLYNVLPNYGILRQRMIVMEFM